MVVMTVVLKVDQRAVWENSDHHDYRDAVFSLEKWTDVLKVDL